MNKAKGIALIALLAAAMMLAATMTLAPMNLMATTDEGNDDDSPALSMTKDSSNPSGHKVKDIQSNENSENAANKIERSQNHDVRGEPSDEPAHTSTRTVERGDTITQTTRESAKQSSGAQQSNANTDSDVQV
jgi:hypothetical protein